MFSGFEFDGEFSEMISHSWHGLAGSMKENDGIAVEVQDVFRVESAECVLVEFESGPARGEADHKDVDVDLDGVFLFDVFVDHFEHFVVHDA